MAATLRAHRRKDVPFVCAVTTLALAALVLLGWAFDIRVLKSLAPSFITMKANTAIGLMAIAAAILAFRAGRQGVSRLFASFAGLVALLTLFEYLLGWNAGIDELLFRDLDGVGAASRQDGSHPSPR